MTLNIGGGCNLLRCASSRVSSLNCAMPLKSRCQAQSDRTCPLRFRSRTPCNGESPGVAPPAQGYPNQCVRCVQRGGGGVLTAPGKAGRSRLVFGSRLSVTPWAKGGGVVSFKHGPG